MNVTAVHQGNGSPGDHWTESGLPRWGQITNVPNQIAPWIAINACTTGVIFGISGSFVAGYDIDSCRLLVLARAFRSPAITRSEKIGSCARGEYVLGPISAIFRPAWAPRRIDHMKFHTGCAT